MRQLRRNHFGRKSERLSDDQLNLGIEDLETAIASGEAAGEKVDAALKRERTQRRRLNRGHLPTHLPREEIIIDQPSKVCPCCGGGLHMIGEDRSERLDKVPAKYRVIVTRRPKYACRSCEKTGADEMAGIMQAPAPTRLVEGGLPTEALVSDVVVSKYAWHLPLYRQAQMMATAGLERGPGVVGFLRTWETGPPPLKWSDFWYQSTRRTANAKQATQARRDRHEAAPG